MSETSHQTSSPAPKRQIKDLPGPVGIPFLGNLFRVTPTKAYWILDQWADKYGPLYKIKLAGKTVIISSAPDIRRKFLQERPGRFSRMHQLEPIGVEMGVNGVFFAEGDDWRRQRFFMNQGLSKRQIDLFFPILKLSTDRLDGLWAKAADSGAVVDVKNHLMRFTVDVTTQVAFGYNMNTLENEKDEIQEELDHVFPMIKRRLFLPIPYWRWFKLPADRRLDKALVEIKKVVNAAIKSGQERINTDKEVRKNPRNFLEALLVAKGEDGSKFSEHEIFANVFTLLLAGEDTAANSMAWIFYYLAAYPELQKKLQEEVDRVLGDDPGMTRPDQLYQLEYAMAIGYESMRLKPIAPGIYLDSLYDEEVHGTHLPAGTSILLLSRHPHIDPKHFPDPHAYRPERWIQGDGSKMSRLNSTCLPFGGGPRTCPGRNLALMEMVIVLAKLARNYDMILMEDSRIPRDEESKIPLVKELKVQFKRRKR